MMTTTVNLDEDAYRLAKVLANDQGVTVGKFLSEIVVERFGTPKSSEPKIEMNEFGWPTIRIGRPITSEEVAEFLASE